MSDSGGATDRRDLKHPQMPPTGLTTLSHSLLSQSLSHLFIIYHTRVIQQISSLGTEIINIVPPSLSSLHSSLVPYISVLLPPFSAYITQKPAPNQTEILPGHSQLRNIIWTSTSKKCAFERENSYSYLNLDAATVFLSQMTLQRVSNCESFQQNELSSLFSLDRVVCKPNPPNTLIT